MFKVDFDSIRKELDAEVSVSEIAKGNIKPLVKHVILTLAESVGGLMHLGATPEFIRSITEEAIHGATKVKSFIPKG